MKGPSFFVIDVVKLNFLKHTENRYCVNQLFSVKIIAMNFF